MVSLAYPIDRLDWALFSVVILFHQHWFPLLEENENRAFILRGTPPSPRGGRSSLNVTSVLYLFDYKDVTTVLYLLVKDLDLCCSGFQKCNTIANF